MYIKSIFLLAFFATSHAWFRDQNWYNFRSGWTLTVFDGFTSQPRTVDEAIAAGWQQVSSDCSDGASFPGIRMAPIKDNGPDMVLIFDANGFIAGMHSVVLKRFASANWQSDSPWYRNDILFGEEGYLTTVYFVDPSVICSGRTQEEFDSQGTGQLLLFQNGPTPMDTIKAPADIDEANASDFWYRHFCFINMGRHYFNLNYDTNAACDPNLVPIQLIYSGDVLNGFVWQHVAKIPGDLWEEVNEFAISQIIDRPPDCLNELSKSPGITTMHNYLRNYETLCINDREYFLK